MSPQSRSLLLQQKPLPLHQGKHPLVPKVLQQTPLFHNLPTFHLYPLASVSVLLDRKPLLLRREGDHPLHAARHPNHHLLPASLHGGHPAGYPAAAALPMRSHGQNHDLLLDQQVLPLLPQVAYP
jgi:hypothetical protein